MKKCLIGFIIALISIIPMSNIKASFDVTYKNETLHLPDMPFNTSTNDFAIFYNTSSSSASAPYTVVWFPKQDTNNLVFQVFGDKWGQLKWRVWNSSEENKNFVYANFKDVTPTNFYNYQLTAGAYNESYDYYHTVLYTTKDIRIYGINSSNLSNAQIERIDPDVNPFNIGDIIFKKPKSKLLEIDHEIKTDSNNNYSYHSINLIANNFNENYKYYFKFETDTTKAIWIDITADLKKNGYHHENLYYNATLYTMVKDENNNTLETRTFTFTDLMTREEYLSPTLDLKVGYSENVTTKMEEAEIEIKINNYSPRFIYQYSFNDYDYFNIDYKDISNSKYYITTHVNTSVYVKILSVQGNVIDKKSINVTGLGLDEDVYTYELTFEDLYNTEQEKNMIYSFYYENKKMETRPYIYIFYEGTQDIKFHLSYGNNVTNLANSILNASDNIKDRLSCINLPYTYQDKNLNIDYSYKNYTLFYFTPCTNFKDVENLELFKDIRVIIKSNINLNIGEPTYIDGVLIPTSRPVTDDFESNYTILFDTFKNAFLRFRNVIVEIIQNISLFFSKISPILQDFYIVIFVLVLFLFLIKFIL